LISPIGLEFADAQLNLVQLQQAKPPLIKAYASQAYPIERAELLQSASAMKDFIKQALQGASFAGRKVVAALPASDVRILSVAYQLKPNETDAQAITKLIKERIGEDLAQFVIDYVPVRTESSNDLRAMVLISERSTVVRYLDLLRKAGLDVEALEVSPVAIRRLVSALIEAGEVPSNVLVINAGANSTYLTMVSGQRLLFDQEVDFGEQALLEQVAIALDVTPEIARGIIAQYGINPSQQVQASPQWVDDTASVNPVLSIVRPHFVNFVAEIKRAVMFASSETRGDAVERAFLMGSLARWRGAEALLSSLANLEVSVPAPLPVADPDQYVDATLPHPELVVAAGLALRGLIDHA
jgi:type IV pilus assembly protein PilM